MRLIDADALIERVYDDIEAIEGKEPEMAMGAIGVLNMIKKAPTELEIVHCKDCENNDANCRGDDNWCYKFGINIDDDDFCSYGEKQVTNKLESVENATSDGEESTISQPKSKLEAGDTISRQAAIDAMMNINTNVRPISESDNVFLIDKAEAMAELRMLPSAQSERPKGEWVDYTEDGYVECPFCHSATNCDGNKDELHFCFSCGADMRGDKE